MRLVTTYKYKLLKTMLLELFGLKPYDAYEEAASLVLTGKLSALPLSIEFDISMKIHPDLVNYIQTLS